jgi:hypothetical protein
MNKEQAAHPGARRRTPAREKVQPEGEPTAGRSPAEAGNPLERRGLPAPSRPDQNSAPVERELPASSREAPPGQPERPVEIEGALWKEQRCPAACPMSARVEQVLRLSSDLRRGMRRLRRELNACQKCPAGEDCRFIRYFQDQVNAAILQVNAEWGLP